MIGVPLALINSNGAVSKEVAIAMAEGALAHSRAGISIAVTGIAGPSGGSAEKPVGLVHIASARQGFATLHKECRFGEKSREDIRHETVLSALALVLAALNS